MKRKRMDQGGHPPVAAFDPADEPDPQSQSVRPAPQRRRLTPFKAAALPRKDFRGQTIKNGVKWRV